MLITGNYDSINYRGLDLVKSWNLYTIRDRRYYFYTVLLFKANHGIASTYLSDGIAMNLNVNGYDTRGYDLELYLPMLREEAFRNSFMCRGETMEWFPEFVQNVTDIESLKRIYKRHIRIITSWWMTPWIIYSVWVIRSVHWYGFVLYFDRHILLNYVLKWLS